jgi:hypothetical protein
MQNTIDKKRGAATLQPGDEERSNAFEQFPEFRRLASRCLLVGKAALGVVGWTLAGSSATAASVGLAGVLFGMLAALVHLDPLWIMASAAYFTYCGVVTGAVLGGFGRILDPVGVADLTHDILRRAGNTVNGKVIRLCRKAGRGNRKTAGFLRL